MTSSSMTESRARSTGATALGVTGFALALALASQVSVPLPGTPVPLTLQPMLVVLAGLMLGPRLGMLSVALWIVAGAAGMPVFTPGGAPGIARLLGPTGGYLLAYPAAAFVAGFLAARFQGFGGRLAGAMAGMLIVHAGGLAQLALLTGSATTGLLLGVVPFAAADGVKAIVAALIARVPIARS